MEFGDNFTMYGTGMGKPGFAVCKPHDGNAATAGNGNMASIACDSRAKVDALYAKAMELGGKCEGPPGVRGEEGDRRPSTAPISATSTATSSPLSASARRKLSAECRRPFCSTAAAARSRRTPTSPTRSQRRSPKRGVDADVELVDGGDCAMRCKAIAERGDALLIVGGGDGTISAAASALVGTETRLGILPLGTLNHFARDLGIPTNLDEAAQRDRGRQQRRVDVAEMNGRIFINNSAIGLYPLMVVDRDLQQQSGSGEASGWRCWSPRSAPWRGSTTSA